MSSTEDDRFSGLAQRFFDQRLMPAARAMRAEGRLRIAPGATAHPASYYETRERTRMKPGDFELDALDSPEELAAALKRLWNDLGTPELAALADSVASLSREAEIEEEAEEVSPFIYVMF